MISTRLRIGSIVASLAILAIGSAATVTTAFAHATSYSPVIGHVYVNDNPVGTNTISAFAEHLDGSLSPLPGSPFATSGQGLGKSLGSQGSLQVSSGGRFLLAADGGSNTISVLRIREDGSLVAISSVNSGGIEPNSIAVHNNLVYVANRGNGTSGADYVGFKLDEQGTLTPIPGASFSIPNQTSGNPGQVLLNLDGTRLVGIEVGTLPPTGTNAFGGAIDSFVVNRDGTLGPDQQYTPLVDGPFGSQFRPTNPSQLFVTNAHGGTGAGAVTAYNDGQEGTLTAIGGAPFADHQTAPCWLGISHDGRFIYAVNTGSTSVSAYAVNPDGSLTLLGSTALTTSNPNGIAILELATDRIGHYAYDVNVKGDELIGLATGPTGAVTELATQFALPAGSSPAGLATTW